MRPVAVEEVPVPWRTVPFEWMDDKEQGSDPSSEKYTAWGKSFRWLRSEGFVVCIEVAISAASGAVRGPASEFALVPASAHGPQNLIALARS